MLTPVEAGNVFCWIGKAATDGKLRPPRSGLVQQVLYGLQREHAMHWSIEYWRLMQWLRSKS